VSVDSKTLIAVFEARLSCMCVCISFVRCFRHVSDVGVAGVLDVSFRSHIDLRVGSIKSTQVDLGLPSWVKSV